MRQILEKQNHRVESNSRLDSFENSSAQKVVCHICSKGLEEGFPVTAKLMNHEIVFFCDVHYSLV